MRVMLHGAQVLGVHDVGAVLVLEGGHLLIGTVGFLQQEHLVGRCADSQGRFRLKQDDVARGVFHRRGRLVFPAAGIGAGALVGIALVHIAREQAPSGIGHAQGTVHKHFQFHGRHLLANLTDFFQGQFP
jgi:hypothetical protein